MDDSVKENILPPVSEENWMSHFQTLHSNPYFVNIKLISYISACFELRDNLVTMITTSNS